VYACREQVCTAVAQPYALYGLKDSGRSVHALGTWPNVSAASTALFDVVAPEDRTGQVFTGGYLANDGARLLGGYSKPDVTGKVAVHALQGGGTQYVSVPGNFAAAAWAGTFYVSGLSEPSFTAAPSVYALKDGAASIVADAGAAAGASGDVAFTSGGVAVFGYADAADDFRNKLFALAPSSLAAPTAPVDFTAQAKLELGETFSTMAFGNGVAVLRGVQDKTTFETAYSDVVRVELAPPATASAAVSPGSPVTVLRFVDACTTVSLESAMGTDLLVRVSDKNGKRLLRLAQRPGAAGRSATPAADCATATYDAQLGTLQLEPGFSVAESAGLPEGVGAVTAVPVAP
jgi:hypothetical protein